MYNDNTDNDNTDVHFRVVTPFNDHLQTSYTSGILGDKPPGNSSPSTTTLGLRFGWGLMLGMNILEEQ